MTREARARTTGTRTTGTRTAADRRDVVPLLAGVFGDHGWNGSSLSLISSRTGLGKGSLYHFFPRGKTEMAEAVLDDVDMWFQVNVFAPLQSATDATEILRPILYRPMEPSLERRLCAPTPRPPRPP